MGAGAAALMESVQRYAAKTASLRAKLFSRDEGADSEAFESSTRASSLAARMVDEKRRSALKGSGVDSHGVVVVDDDDPFGGGGGFFVNCCCFAAAASPVAAAA